MSRPLVTVGLPVFNGERYLADAIDALRRQTYEELEIVICDNASTDTTLEVGRAAAADDPRIRVVTADRNRGASWNFNRALDHARGSLFTWASYDDLRAPTAIACCVDALQAQGPATVLAYPGTLLIDEAGDEVGPFEDGFDLSDPSPLVRLRRLLEDANEYHPIFGVIRSEVLRATPRLGSFVASDVVLLAELALAGRWVRHPERLFLRRFHENTSLAANPDVADRAAWFDPARRGGALTPCTRVGAELLRAVGRSPLGGADRARAMRIVLASWYGRQWRTVGGEVKRSARRALARSTGGRA
ncbi:MAG: glycosyltransferase family 2 protein [Acidimicrobiales bacterium]